MRSKFSGFATLFPTLVLIAGCATPVPSPDVDGWHPVALPGKKPTHYETVLKDGRPAWLASADASASMLRRKVNVDAAALRDVQFSWRVDALMPDTSVSEVDRSDASARVILAFDGDVSKLSARTRAMFELAHALTGEPPPYATLMYVWDAKAPVGSVIVNGRTDRVRKIVVDSGSAALTQWRLHRRDIAADFKLAFGEPPGALLAMGVMTDSDNSRQRTQAWYEVPRLVD